MSDHEKDLPLMANAQEILVTHYLLFLSCDLGRRTFTGEIYMTLMPVSTENCKTEMIDKTEISEKRPFNLILDSKDIDVRQVSQVCVDRHVVFTRSSSNDTPDIGCSSNSNELMRPTFALTMSSAAELRILPTVQLEFSVEPWCVRIWKRGVTEAGLFPQLVVIKFETTAVGASIKWTKDQDNRDCCFTHGAWINNRSLFPCQEPPEAMATWQAFVTVPSDAIVIMSGDCEPYTSPAEGFPDGFRTFYFHTFMKLPMATLALAIGYWKIESLNKPSSPWVYNLENADEYCYKRDGVLAEDVVCRIVAAESILSKAVQEFGDYLLKCVKSATQWLGLYPFRRLDLLFMPRCFDCLGMASPNVTFVSQSMLSGDGSMSVHLAHEVAHAWFGLLIGARDWTEEWLSEGFATFMEDVIHQSCFSNMSAHDLREWRQMRTFQRYRALCSELENTDDSLQTLRPNKGEEIIDPETSIVYVKNGMNDDKLFTQVHYLKGYFLLKYLCDLVGFQPFMASLATFIQKYHGQLVHSKEVLEIFLNDFPKISDHKVTLEVLYEQWLDFPGVPPMLQNYKPSANNALYSQVLEQVVNWKNVNQVFLGQKRNNRKKSKFDLAEFKQLNMEQIILLLELFLDEPRLSSKMMKKLSDHHGLQYKNANIRHRWCELVVKHNYTDGLKDVKSFFIEDQAMGVYLYGELMVSEKFRLQNLARECWNIVGSELSPSAAQVVREMVQ